MIIIWTNMKSFDIYICCSLISFAGLVLTSAARPSCAGGEYRAGHCVLQNAYIVSAQRLTHRIPFAPECCPIVRVFFQLCWRIDWTSIEFTTKLSLQQIKQLNTPLSIPCTPFPKLLPLSHAHKHPLSVFAKQNVYIITWFIKIVLYMCNIDLYI